MSAGALSIQNSAVVPAGVLVTLYAPNGELITVQHAGERRQQRWALSTIRAHTQEDAPLGGQSSSRCDSFHPQPDSPSLCLHATSMGTQTSMSRRLSMAWGV